MVAFIILAPSASVKSVSIVNPIYITILKKKLLYYTWCHVTILYFVKCHLNTGLVETTIVYTYKKDI